MIAIDWGTSRLRLYLLGADGTVRERRGSDAGIASLGGAGFDEALAPLLAGWPENLPLLMCGMIGSRQGILEAPYLACPADPASLARALVPVTIAGRAAHIVPGLSCDPPDVMRGEETLILGAGISGGLACLPGSHSKWVRVQAGIVTGFRTYLTGELFAAVVHHTIVGRLMDSDDPADWPDFFDHGVTAAREPRAALTAQLFMVRAAGLLGRLPTRGLRPFASGLLIGHEILGEAPAGLVTLIGEGPLMARYARALDSFRVPHETAAPEPAPAGLFAIARAAGLLA
jgi:2-dehydro-3-deoxygalactonokinase